MLPLPSAVEDPMSLFRRRHSTGPCLPFFGFWTSRKVDAHGPGWKVQQSRMERRGISRRFGSRFAQLAKDPDLFLFSSIFFL